MADTTVELPADPEIKQLAHDIEREGEGWSIDLLLDLYEYLSAFDSEEYKSHSDIRMECEKRTDIDFASLLTKELCEKGYLEEHRGGTKYTLAVDASE